MPQAPVVWLGDAEAKPAPEPLARVQALMNTLDLESGTDRLADPADAGPWLRSQGLLGADSDPGSDDLRTIRTVREALRAMLVHNAGGPAPSTPQMLPLRHVAECGWTRTAVSAWTPTQIRSTAGC
jgi:hypothetical protein